MKKTILLALIGIVISTGALHAQKLKFYYYPASNVYYYPAGGTYAYNNGGSWVTTRTLPGTYVVNNTPRYVVYNQTPDVWVNNQTHITRYKANGQVKTYKNVPPGKAKGLYKNGGPASGKGKGHGNGKH